MADIWLALFAIAVPIALIVWVWFSTRYLRQLKTRYADKIKHRTPIAFRDFAARHFPNCDPDVVCGILESIKVWAAVPTDRLDPEDHMVKDLTVGAWDGLEPAHLIADIEDRFNADIVAEKTEEAETLGQFIELCCRKLAQSNTQMERTRSAPGGPSASRSQWSHS